MTKDEQLRYSRHMIMPEVGAEGQERLNEARVLCIGAGGLVSTAKQQYSRRILAVHVIAVCFQNRRRPVRFRIARKRACSGFCPALSERFKRTKRSNSFSVSANRWSAGCFISMR